MSTLSRFFHLDHVPHVLAAINAALQQIALATGLAALSGEHVDVDTAVNAAKQVAVAVGTQPVLGLVNGQIDRLNLNPGVAADVKVAVAQALLPEAGKLAGESAGPAGAK